MVDLKVLRRPPEAADADLAFDLIERMFFGYRDFVGVADDALTQTGYGRAHHRVLHFVDRHPGLTVGELLSILKVTKQGLSRVLKTLVDDGLIKAEPGVEDRREKRLSTTSEGHDLARHLVRLQTMRIDAALAAAGPEHRATIAAFLAGLVNDDERDDVLARIEGGR
ncbi:MAG: MarR family transcriptional regulator [Pseudomonadota bacterium]